MNEYVYRSLEDLLSRISFSNKFELFLTPEQIHNLSALSFEQDIPFFGYESSRGPLVQSDSNFLYDFLSIRIDIGNTVEEIIEEIAEIILFYRNHVSHYKLLFKTGDFFHKEEFALQDELKRIRGDITLLEPGFHKCKDCGSNRTISISVQTRGGDEGTDTFNECIACGYKWRIKG